MTGYTQTTKRRSTGSVGIIKKEVFENRPVSSVDNLLQGQIAGVSVLATSGRPGASSKIRIRGTNTLTGNAEPLWVVDGVPLQKDIPDISAGQIKSGDFDLKYHFIINAPGRNGKPPAEIRAAGTGTFDREPRTDRS